MCILIDRCISGFQLEIISLTLDTEQGHLYIDILTACLQDKQTFINSKPFGNVLK